jgi:hypothetical protein
MIFRSGKYQGYSVDEVRRMAPWYIRWVQENRPEMLRERTPRKKTTTKVTEDEEVTRAPKVKHLASWDEAF